MSVPKSEILRRNRFIRASLYIPMNIKRYIDRYLFQISEDSERIAKLRNKYNGNRCFIIGNGPSLTIDDLELLNGEYTFCTNMIYKVFDKTSFRPKFYVAADPNFFPDYMNEVLKYDINTYFVTVKAKKRMVLPDNAYCFNVSGPFCIVKESMKNDDFSDDASKYLALSYTVTFYAIQLAIYMGFKDIYLLGVDHKYAVTADSKGRVHQDDSVTSSHMIGTESDSKASLQAFDSTTYSYIIARDYADNHSIRIRNATRGGVLEVFERVCLDDVL